MTLKIDRRPLPHQGPVGSGRNALVVLILRRWQRVVRNQLAEHLFTDEPSLVQRQRPAAPRTHGHADGPDETACRPGRIPRLQVPPSLSKAERTRAPPAASRGPLHGPFRDRYEWPWPRAHPSRGRTRTTAERLGADRATGRVRRRRRGRTLRRGRRTVVARRRPCPRLRAAGRRRRAPRRSRRSPAGHFAERPCWRRARSRRGRNRGRSAAESRERSR